MSRIRSLFLATAAALSLFSATNAQQLFPNSLPTCAQQCSLLIQVTQTCDSNPPAAESCLCQTTLLSGIKTNPSANLCLGFCSDADWTAIVQWYQSTCANGGASTLATSATPAAPGVSTSVLVVTASGSSTPSQASSQSGAATAQATAANAGTSGSSAVGAGNSAAGNYSNGQQWWQTHYQWIIMVIVLLVVFSILGVGGAILFRRHRRRRDFGSMSSSNVSMWNPNASAHAVDQQAAAQLARHAGKGVMMTEKEGMAGAPRGSSGVLAGSGPAGNGKPRGGVLKKMTGR